MSSILRPTINLGNSILGVSILTMPWCFAQCGVVLGTLLLLLSALFTSWTCKMLLRAAHMTRQHSYETLGLAVYSSIGKLGIELSNIGLGIGTCVAFYIIIGDLLPPLVAKTLNLDWDPSILRGVLLVFSGVGVAFPLTLIRNLDRLSVLSIGSLIFYSFFIVQLVISSRSNLTAGVWSEVIWWRTSGVLKCLPIFSLAFCCQSQMFVIYMSLREGNVRKMTTIVDGSIAMVTVAYLSVAVFGYLSYYTVDIHGDVLANFPLNLLSQITRFGFAVTVMLSFPLIVFPCRVSINSLLFPEKNTELHVTTPIPQGRFVAITAGVMSSTLVLAILIPNIQTVLALVGATLGSLICFIFPGLFFNKVAGSNTDYTSRAKFCVGLGLSVLVLSTFVTLNTWSEESSVQSHIQPPPQQLDIVKFPPLPVDIHEIDKEMIEKDELQKKELPFEPVAKNPDSVIINEDKPVSKETKEMEKVHEKLEEKISELANKVDKLQEDNKDLRERQEEIDKVPVKDLKAAKDDKMLPKEPSKMDTPQREGDEEHVAVGNQVPSNDKADKTDETGKADKASDHVMKKRNEVEVTGHVIKSPDHVIKSASHKDPEELDKVELINQEKADDKYVVAKDVQVKEPIGVAKDYVGVAKDDMGVVNPAKDEVKIVNGELKEEFKAGHKNEPDEHNEAHLGGGRDLKNTS